jgi:hypothetical protein
MRKTKYAKIGRDGTVDKFVEAFERVANPHWSYETAREKRKILADEAVRAFHEEHPEKVQVMLAANPARFKRGDYYHAFVADVLYKISEKNEDRLADINLALASVPEENRKEILSRVLYDAVCDREMCKEPFVDVLLKAGTDPDAVVDGQAGHILFKAIQCCRPEPVIKLLADGGASFEAALTLSQTRDYYKKDVGSILLYQEKFAKKPAAATEELSEIQQLRDEMRALNGQFGEVVAELKRLSSLVEGSDASEAKEIDKTPQKNDSRRFDRLDILKPRPSV